MSEIEIKLNKENVRLKKTFTTAREFSAVHYHSFKCCSFVILLEHQTVREWFKRDRTRLNYFQKLVNLRLTSILFKMVDFFTLVPFFMLMHRQYIPWNRFHCFSHYSKTLDLFLLLKHSKFCHLARIFSTWVKSRYLIFNYISEKKNHTNKQIRVCGK